MSYWPPIFDTHKIQLQRYLFFSGEYALNSASKDVFIDSLNQGSSFGGPVKRFSLVINRKVKCLFPRFFAAWHIFIHPYYRQTVRNAKIHVREDPLLPVDIMLKKSVEPIEFHYNFYSFIFYQSMLIILILWWQVQSTAKM